MLHGLLEEFLYGKDKLVAIRSNIKNSIQLNKKNETYDFNRNYKIIFGHIDIDVDEVWDYQCKCTDPQFGWVTYHDGPCDNQPETQEWYCHDVIGQLSYTVTEKDHPGDGVVPKYSASSFPGARASTLMPGSNHQQMRNDENTVNAFYRMYETEEFGKIFNQTIRE